jgi:hypothetical protein
MKSQQNQDHGEFKFVTRHSYQGSTLNRLPQDLEAKLICRWPDPITSGICQTT